MNIKRISGVVVLIIGAALFVFGSYVSEEVAGGRQKISSAQKSVDQVDSLSKMSPYTKGVGGMATGSAQKKIDKGREDVAKYQMLANLLHGSGVVLFIAGVGLVALSFMQKKRH